MSPPGNDSPPFCVTRTASGRASVTFSPSGANLDAAAPGTGQSARPGSAGAVYPDSEAAMAAMKMACFMVMDSPDTKQFVQRAARVPWLSRSFLWSGY